jgi:hypothetical protein
VAIASQHRGYTGTGYVDYTNGANDFVEWTVNVAVTRTYTLTFRYANGGTTDRQLAISVNGTVIIPKLTFNPTDSWSTWANVSLNAVLPAGASVKIRATATGASGGNIDSLTIS